MPVETVSARDIGGSRRFRGGADALVVRIAERQHGVVARRQLLELGLGEDAIDHRLEIGRLHAVARGVYAVGHRVLAPQGTWMAAVLSSGSDAVLSHRFAGALWGIRDSASGPVEVTASRKSTSTSFIRRHHSTLPDDEVTVHEGIPVTALCRGIERLPSGRTRSRLEERFLPFLRRHRLPRPRLNDWIMVGEKRYQVDCHWHGTGQIVELDSWEAHGTRSAFREDRAGDRTLCTAGYTVTRVSLAQLDDEPEAVASDLRKLLAL